MNNQNELDMSAHLNPGILAAQLQNPENPSKPQDPEDESGGMSCAHQQPNVEGQDCSQINQVQKPNHEPGDTWPEAMLSTKPGHMSSLTVASHYHATNEVQPTGTIVLACLVVADR